MKILLTIGINYINSNNRLRGCINDSNGMKAFFTKKGYEVIQLDDYNLKPTRKNILEAFKEVLQKVNSSSEECTVILHYSGHGYFVKDLSGDEKDHRDEVLVTADFQYISDDLINLFLKKLKSSTKCFCLFDCCHSGSVADLQYHENVNENKKNYVDCEVVCISGSRDDQTSADIPINGDFYGALTFYFLEAVKKKDPKDFNELVEYIRQDVEIYKQTPQLTHSHKQIFGINF